MSGVPGDEEVELEEHLRELTRRLLYVMFLIGACALVLFPLSGRIIAELKSRFVTGGADLIALNPLEYLWVRVEIAVVLSLVLGTPLLVYEVFKFMSPGLYPSEKRFFIGVIPSSLVLLLLGALFSYVFVIPVSMKVLIDYTADYALPTLVLRRFVSFILFMLYGFGLIFQIPLVIALLVKGDLIKVKDLKDKRKYVYVAFLVLAGTLTPDPTPVTPIIIAATLIAMYEISLFLVRFMG